MPSNYDNIATPFLPERVNEFPGLGYDCSCNAPSVYRQVIDGRGKSTVFSLCPVCDNLPQELELDFGNGASNEL